MREISLPRDTRQCTIKQDQMIIYFVADTCNSRTLREVIRRNNMWNATMQKPRVSQEVQKL
jgi:hypothetical protein